MRSAFKSNNLPGSVTFKPRNIAMDFVRFYLSSFAPARRSVCVCARAYVCAYVCVACVYDTCVCVCMCGYMYIVYANTYVCKSIRTHMYIGVVVAVHGPLGAER